MNKFQETLKELLDEKSLSRLALAKILNISSTTINGYLFPRTNNLIEIVKYFNVSLDFLVGDVK